MYFPAFSLENCLVLNQVWVEVKKREAVCQKETAKQIYKLPFRTWHFHLARHRECSF